MAKQRRKSGFTLIELSVVLVVIGFLTAGIFVGQSMIRQSQIMSAMSDEQKYTKAVLAFQDKYAALPGDMANATSYWGVAGGSTSDNYTGTCYGSTTRSSPLTCNGNGDGQISRGDNYGYGSISDADEKYLMWQQLADAGLIKGNYAGVVPTTGGNAWTGTPGVNAPLLGLSNASLGINYVGYTTGGGQFFPGNFGHLWRIGGSNATPGIQIVFTTAEAQSVDSKYDDGLPGTGTIMSFVNGTAQAPNCATTAVASTAAYNLSVSGPQCALLVISGF